MRSTVLFLFLSTLSVRRATCCFCFQFQVYEISIHALREESDANSTFYEDFANWVISIHALREESDARAAPNTGGKHIFLSTLSVRRATGKEAD